MRRIGDRALLRLGNWRLFVRARRFNAATNDVLRLTYQLLLKSIIGVCFPHRTDRIILA